MEQKHPNRFRLLSKHGVSIAHYPGSRLLSVPDESMSSIELRQLGLPPLPTGPVQGSTSWWKLRCVGLPEKSLTALTWRFHATAKLGVQNGAAV